MASLAEVPRDIAREPGAHGHPSPSAAGEGQGIASEAPVKGDVTGTQKRSGDVPLTGLQTEAQLGPRGDRRGRLLGGRRRLGHGEAPLAPDGIDHLALRPLGPQGTYLRWKDRKSRVRVCRGLSCVTSKSAR